MVLSNRLSDECTVNFSAAPLLDTSLNEEAVADGPATVIDGSQ